MLDDCKAIALTAIKQGLSVIPVAFDGTKRPLLTRWVDYQEKRATPEQVESWFTRWPEAGIGIIGGAVSGGLIWLDFDKKTAFREFCTLARLSDNPELKELVSRVRKGYTEATPKGVHIAVRCEMPLGCLKLANTGRVDDSGKPVYKNLANGKQKQEIDVLVETKAEGGYCIVAPSAGAVHPSGQPYTVIEGSLETIQTITPSELELLLELARSMHQPTQDELEQLANQAKFEAKRTEGKGTDRLSSDNNVDDDTLRPGDDFNQRATWEDVLKPHSWKQLDTSQGKTYWRRPGKSEGISAVSNEGSGDDALFFAFTTSTEFEGGIGSGKGYTKFSAYALLNHNNDFEAAAKELASMGYGTQIEKRVKPKTKEERASELDKIVSSPNSNSNSKADPKPAKKLPKSPFEPMPIDIHINQQWSSDYIADYVATKKITLFKGHMGGGKTSGVTRILARNDMFDASILSIGPSVALLQEQCELWELENYQAFGAGGNWQNFKDQKIDRKGLTDSNRLAICLNSLPQLTKARKYEYILLDEVERLLRHSQGETTKKNRAQIMAMLKTLLMQADHVLCFDADLSPVAYRFFERLVGAENIQVIVNDYVRPDAPQILAYDDKNELTGVMLDYVRSGGNAYIATNSQAEALRLERVIAKEFPGLPTLCISSKNAAKPEIQEALKDLNSYAKAYRVLIASPTIQTGINIKDPHFGQTFVIGVHGSTDHNSLLQHVWRNRCAGLVHSFIMSGQRFEPTKPEYWRKYRLDKDGRTGILIDEEHRALTGERIAHPSEVDNLYLWGDIQAADKFSHNNLAANFYSEASKNGHTIKLVNPPLPTPSHPNPTPDPDGGQPLQPPGAIFDPLADNRTPEQVAKDESTEHAKDLRNEAKAELEAERVDGIVAADLISEKRAEKLRNKAYLAEGVEDFELEKFELWDYYGLEVNEFLVKADNKHKSMRSTLRYLMLKGEIDPVARDQAFLDSYSNLMTDARHETLATRRRAELFKLIGLTENGNEITAQTLADNGVIDFILENKGSYGNIYKDLGLTVKSDFAEKPFEFISALFKQVGLKLTSRKVGARGQQIIHYKIDPESLDTLKYLAAARLNRIAEKERAKADNSPGLAA